MRIAILGAGAIAYGTAALLTRDGHDVTLWSPSGRRTAALAAGAPLIASGLVIGSFQVRIGASCADALTSAEAVIIAVPGYAHRYVLEAAAPHLRSEQVVVFSSHLSLAALYLARLLHSRGVQPAIAALGTTVLTGRQTAPDAVTVRLIRSKIDVAVLPEAETTRAINICQTLFGDRFTVRAGLLAVSLSNLNPQNHLAIALCNLTRMEIGETWGQTHHTTPAVTRLIEALDVERLTIASAVGCKVRTVHEHYHLTCNVPVASLADMMQMIGKDRKDVNGPVTLDSRYVTEDIPFGVVPTLKLAALAGVPAPLHLSGLRLMSALYSRDFEGENDILPLLGELSLEMLNHPG